MNTEVLLRSSRQCMKNPAVDRNYSLLKRPNPLGSAVGMRYYSTEKKPEKSPFYEMISLALTPSKVLWPNSDSIRNSLYTTRSMLWKHTQGCNILSGFSVFRRAK
ncbi:hypothetical protein HanXRQr2_Chr08g0333701 [Helianthus annuus]|uniref:Uncharacterized protein n=1 Tax=Helianthus annuus TaxID=4232 RepID=A0A251U605_HELAN|nr:hypothetical protein HanXRQr2_Chr08g0333701 [Helianthus annuus]KAJ0901196.1 hypothetical protein HanPSC8_Chr08g0322511 [Helianthus annuus]